MIAAAGIGRDLHLICTTMNFLRILPLLALLITGSAFGQASKTKLKARVSTYSDVADDLVPVSTVTVGSSIIILKDRAPGLDEKGIAKAIPKLELYDGQKLSHVRSTVPSEKYLKQPVMLEQLVEFAGSPFLIASLRKLDKGSISVMGTKVDPNLTKPSEPYEDLVVFETGYNGASFEPMNSSSDEFEAKVSTKTGHLLITSPVLRTAGRSAFLMASMDKSRKVQWQHVVELDAAISAAEIAGSELDADGNAWLLVRQQYKDRKAGQIQEEMKLFHVSAEGVRGIRFGLDRDAYVKSAVLKRSADGSMRIAGLHSSTAEGWKADQFFTVPVPTTVDDLKEPNIITTSLGIPATRLEVRDLLRSANGNDLLIVEEYEFAEIAHHKTLKKSWKHVHGPVYVFALDKSGNERWNSTFRRSVHSDHSVLGMPMAAVFENELSLFLVDSEKQNAMRGDDSKPLSHLDVKDPYSVQVTFDDAGKFRSRNILGSGLDATLIAGEHLKPFGANKYLAYGTRTMDGKGYLPVDLEFSK